MGELIRQTNTYSGSVDSILATSLLVTNQFEWVWTQVQRGAFLLLSQWLSECWGLMLNVQYSTVLSSQQLFGDIVTDYCNQFICNNHGNSDIIKIRLDEWDIFCLNSLKKYQCWRLAEVSKECTLGSGHAGATRFWCRYINMSKLLVRI